MTKVWIVLLRGINITGKNKLPMKDLAALCEAAGGEEVWTYIQSGNVVLRAADEEPSALGERLAAGITARFGYDCPAVVLSVAELERIVADNPWAAAADEAELSTLYVAFLQTTPEEARAAAMDPDRSPPDTFVVKGRAIHMRCPKGQGRSKLTNAWFDSRLKTLSTIRNWRTTLALLDRARAMQTSS